MFKLITLCLIGCDESSTSDEAINEAVLERKCVCGVKIREKKDDDGVVVKLVFI